MIAANALPLETPWSELTIAISGMNNRPDNPGPGYGVARCIREEQGFSGRIIGLGYDVLDGGLYYSQVSDAGYLLPYPSSGEAAFLERLIEIHAQERINVLIPCLDAELLYIANLRETLSAMGIAVLLPSAQQINARGKESLPALCQQLAIKTPRCKKIFNKDFFYTCQRDGWGYPLVVKGMLYDAGIAHNPAQACEIFENIAAQWGLPLLAQAFVEGEELNLTALGDGEGGMLGTVMMRKRALTDKGKAWAGICIDDPALRTMAEKIVGKLKWRGPLEVEVLKDKRGELYLLEINPRFPSWIYLSKGAGCNLPVALIKQLANSQQDTLATPKLGSLFIRYAQEMVLDISSIEQMTMLGFVKEINE